MKHLGLVLAVACAVTAAPALAEGTLVRKAPAPMSTRIAQYPFCTEGLHKCCCDKVGPLCCPGTTCVMNGNVGYCVPDN